MLGFELSKPEMLSFLESWGTIRSNFSKH